MPTGAGLAASLIVVALLAVLGTVAFRVRRAQRELRRVFAGEDVSRVRA